ICDRYKRTLTDLDSDIAARAGCYGKCNASSIAPVIKQSQQLEIFVCDRRMSRRFPTAHVDICRIIGSLKSGDCDSTKRTRQAGIACAIGLTHLNVSSCISIVFKLETGSATALPGRTTVGAVFPGCAVFKAADENCIVTGYT